MKLILLVFTFLLLACSEPKPGTTSEVAAEKSTDSPLRELLDYYPEAGSFPLFIHTSALDFADAKGEMAGRMIPKELFSLLDGAIPGAEGADVFAVYQIPLSNEKVALLTRVPGMYVSSRIVISIADKKTGRISDHLEIAESWGDAGDLLVKKTWIRKEKGSDLTLNTEQEFCHYIDSIPAVNDCVDSLFQHKVSGDKILSVSKELKGRRITNE